MLLRLFAALTLVLPSTALAQSAVESSHNDTFQSLCKEESVSGLNWKDGEWVHARFREDTFIVRKIRPPAQLDRDRWSEMPVKCMGDDWEERKENFKLFHEGQSQKRIDFGCYLTYQIGQEPNPLSAEICSELFVEDSKLLSISCERLTFVPNGHFHRAHWHDQLEDKPEGDRKDSMYVSAGKCSVIE